MSEHDHATNSRLPVIAIFSCAHIPEIGRKINHSHVVIEALRDISKLGTRRIIIKNYAETSTTSDLDVKTTLSGWI